MICRNCGKELGEEAKFCINCGTKVEKTDDIPQSDTILDEGTEKTVYLPEEEPAETNTAFFGDDKTVLLDEEPAETNTAFFGDDKTVLLDEEPAETNTAFFGDDKTVLLDEESAGTNTAFFGDDKTVLLDEESAGTNTAFSGDDKTVLLDEEPAGTNTAFFGDDKTVLLDEESAGTNTAFSGDDKTVMQNEEVPSEKDSVFFGDNNRYPEAQPQPVQNYSQQQYQQPVQNYSQQQQYGGYVNPDMGAVPPMPAPVPQKEASAKVGKGRIFGASIVAFFAILFLIVVNVLVCCKIGLSGGTLRKRVEKLNVNTFLNAELDGKDVSENIYNSVGFRTVSDGNADISDFKEYIKNSDILEYAGDNIENYADYIINGNGDDPSINSEDITYDFFAENNDAADDAFGYEFRKDDLKKIRKNLESEGVDEALSVKEWKKEIGIDPKNVSYAVSYITIGIVSALVLIMLIWIVIIVDKKGRHVMKFFGNVLFISGLVIFLCGAAVTGGAMIAFSLTSNVVFYLISNILLTFGILALIIGFSEIVFGLIFKKIGKALKNKSKKQIAI